MPRDSNGNYSLPPGNPVAEGELLDVDWGNPTMEDIAEALNDSLSRSGQGGMLVPLEFDDGTEALPGIAWKNEPTSGFYRNDTGDMQVSILGGKIFRWLNDGAYVWNEENAEWWRVVASNNITIDQTTGDTTVAGDVNFTGTVNIDNTPISEFVSGVPAAVPHRYWRITVNEVQGGAGNGELRLNELIFWANGMPFVNGKRYAPGTDITDLIQNIDGNAVPSAGSREALIDGVYDSFGASFPNAVLNGVTFVVDFGEASPQRVTSIQQVQFAAAEDWMSGFTLAYSDNNVEWTDVGEFTGILTGTVDEPSLHFTATEQVDTYEPDGLETYPVPAVGDLKNVDDDGIADTEVLAFDAASGTYIPAPNGGGGGSISFFNFQTPRATNQSAVAGNYYFATANQTITLPASPSIDDFVGIRAFAGVTCTIDRNGQQIEGQSNDATVGDANQGFKHVGLVFTSTGGWRVFQGQLEIVV